MATSRGIAKLWKSVVNVCDLDEGERFWSALTGLSPEAASGELPVVVDALQQSTGQGPCLDAAYVHETVRVTDMASETRWPVFAPLAADAGAAGMLACQLYVDGDDVGALNLFSRTAGRLDEESEHVALMFAAHATVAYAAAQQRDTAAP